MENEMEIVIYDFEMLIWIVPLILLLFVGAVFGIIMLQLIRKDSSRRNK